MSDTIPRQYETNRKKIWNCAMTLPKFASLETVSPLASYIKRTGKQTIYMGGNLQLLFGIKGRRWNNAGLYNEYWVRPSEVEKQKRLTQVEGGCY